MKPFLIPSQTMASIGKLSWRWAEHLSLMHHNLPLICINVKDELEEMSSWYPSQQEQRVHVQHIADTEPKLYWKSPHELKCYGCGSRRSDAGEEVIYFASQLNGIVFTSGCRCPLLSVAWKPASDSGGVRTWRSLSDVEKLFWSTVDRCQISRASSSLLDFEKRCDQCQILRNDAVIVRFRGIVVVVGRDTVWSFRLRNVITRTSRNIAIVLTLRNNSATNNSWGWCLQNEYENVAFPPYLFCEEKCNWKEMDSVTAVHF